jgi:DNA-directed RNA polymerase specialized sigma24 family protein
VSRLLDRQAAYKPCTPPVILTFSTGQLVGSAYHAYNGASQEVTVRKRSRTLSTTPPKSDPDEISQEQFDQLLHWLDPDRDKAAVRYEWIRKRLIKIFVSRGSTIPEELADKTINRVARKLQEIRATYVGEPANYFAGVAGNIFRESLRKEKVPAIGMPEPAPPNEDEDRIQSCFEQCIAKLSAREREMVLSYYQLERQAKIDHRKSLAERLGMGLNALRIRACRIRARLQECVEGCCAAPEPTVKQNAGRGHT